MRDVPTKDEVREAYEAAMAVALAMTRSKERAADLVQDAFERILTTRPWARDNDVARRVLRCRREHGLSKAAEIAEKLGTPVEKVYRANETLRERLRALRKDQQKEEP
jgi:DNA-directed RNA polymerase specialized sigma24 family protein